jgi:hypothetical protein
MSDVLDCSSEVAHAERERLPPVAEAGVADADGNRSRTAAANDADGSTAQTEHAPTRLTSSAVSESSRWQTYPPHEDRPRFRPCQKAGTAAARSLRSLVEDRGHPAFVRADDFA